jgi:hypothetical protein
MVKFILTIGLSALLAPSSSSAQIDTIPQRIRNGKHATLISSSATTEEGDELFGRTQNYNNLRKNGENTERSLQLVELSMSIPSIDQADMSMPSGGDNTSTDLPTYSPLPAPNLDDFNVDEVVSWICRFCPATICSNCPSRM